MKMSLFLLAMISAVFASTAAAQGQGFFAGLGVGRSSADVTEITRQDVLGVGFSSLNSFQNGSNTSDTAWNFYGGYRFNPIVAAEVIYANFGEFSRYASGSGLTSSSGTINFNLNSNLKITGFGASALVGVPLKDRWNIFAKPGLFYWDAKETITATTNSTLSGSTDKKGTSLSFGLGTAYAFTDKISARLEWEEFFDVGDKGTTGKSNVNLFALSVQFTL